MASKVIIIKRILFTTLTLSLVAFIFINSSFDAQESSGHSLGIRAMINDFLHSLNINITLTDFFVRKCAHFAEFFVLGTLLFYTVKSYLSKLDYKILTAPLLGLVVASIDETIQLFSDGRSGQFTDVMLDFFGVCTAVLILFVVYKLIHKHEDKEVEDESSKKS